MVVRRALGGLACCVGILVFGGCDDDRALPVTMEGDLRVRPDMGVAHDLSHPDLSILRDFTVVSDLTLLPGYPAPHPPLPQAVSSGGPILAAPELTAITFGADPLQARIDAFVAAVGTSSWWRSTVSEYGVGPAHARPAIHLAALKPVTLDDTEIADWLVTQLDGTHPEFGTPNANSLYLLFYPAQVDVTLGSAMACADFGAYHNSTELPNGTEVAYAVMPRCAGRIEVVTEAAGHELVEAATDPLPLSTPAYIDVASRDRGWSQVFHGGEVGDLCAWETQVVVRAADIGAAVPRVWSNAAARVDHDPCIPEIGRSFYFNSAPVLASPRLTLRVGVPQTIELDLFSTGPTGTWDLDAMVPPSLGSSYIFDFQPRAGKNGDKVNLTVTLQSTGGPSFHEGFIITSTLGGTTHLWPVGVVAR